MKHIDASLQQASGPGWQILGELQLTVDPDTDHTVGKWLSVILSPLDVHADFLDKVLKSAQEAMGRAMQAADASRIDHLHLLVFVPIELPSTRSSWGFFRIEKLETDENRANPEHAVEFYLYLEGGPENPGLGPAP